MRTWLRYKLLDYLHDAGYAYHDRWEPVVYWWLERGLLRRIWRSLWQKKH